MRLPFLLLTCTTAFVLSVAGGQHGGGAASGKSSGRSGMPMMEMAERSRGACMSVPDTLDNLLNTVREAMKSDDKAKMKAALKMSEAHVAAMQAHMGRCKDMMGKMMQDGMMGNDSAKAVPKADSGMQSGDSDAEHEKHHPE